MENCGQLHIWDRSRISRRITSSERWFESFYRFLQVEEKFLPNMVYVTPGHSFLLDRNCGYNSNDYYFLTCAIERGRECRPRLPGRIEPPSCLPNQARTPVLACPSSPRNLQCTKKSTFINFSFLTKNFVYYMKNIMLLIQNLKLWFDQKNLIRSEFQHFRI